MTAEERSIRNGGNGEHSKAGPTIQFTAFDPALKGAAILYVKDAKRLAEILDTLGDASTMCYDETDFTLSQELSDIAESFRLAGKLAWGE